MLVVRQEATTILGTSVLMPRSGQGEAHTFYRRQGLDVWKMVASKTLVALWVGEVPSPLPDELFTRFAHSAGLGLAIRRSDRMSCCRSGGVWLVWLVWLV